MTALSPGPWTYNEDSGHVEDAGGLPPSDSWQRRPGDGRAMATAYEALAVLSKLVERAQKVADNFPGKKMERLLSTVSAIEVPVDIIREALDALKKAGVR